MEGSRERAATLLDEARRRYEAGDHADAEPLARGAFDVLADDADPASAALRVAALQLRGECAFSGGRYGEAQAHADEVLRLRGDAPAIDRAETSNLLGIIALAMGDAPRGYALVSESLAIREAELGPDATDTLESLNNSGVGLGRLGRMEEAIAVHEDALRRCERAFDGPSRQLLVTCNALAVKLDRSDETRPRALALYERGLAAGEAALGPEHPLVVTTLANLGTAYANAGDPVRARELIERSLALHERRYGPEHPNTATVLVTASVLARGAGELDRAREYADRAVRIRLDTFGIRDRRTRDAVGSLALAHEALLKAGRGEMADGIALLAVWRDLSTTGAVDPVRFTPDPDAAERALRGYLARAAARGIPPDDGVVRARSRAEAAGLAADAALLAGDLATASVAAGERVAILEAALGPTALELIEPLHRLAAVDIASGSPERGLGAERRALDILAASYGDRHAFVLRARARLAADTGRLLGSAAARPELLALEAILANSEPGGFAAALHARVVQMLERADRNEPLSGPGDPRRAGVREGADRPRRN